MIFRKTIAILVCIGLAAVLILDSSGIASAVSRTIGVCLNTIIPSLFAFLALSTFAVSSGLVKSDFAVFAMSLVGGYPVGAKLLSCHANPRKAESMLMYCYCASPVFLVAIAGRIGIFIWLSNAAACVLFAIAARIAGIAGGKAHESPAAPEPPTAAPDGRRFGIVDSVISAGTTLYRICVIMLLFAAGIRVLEFAGIMQHLPDYAYAVAEVTNIMGLNASPTLLAVLTSFGGLCVIFQTAAITRGRLKLRKFALARLPIAAISGGICYVMTRGLPVDAVQTMTSRRVVISAAGSEIASICLLVMTLILLSSRDRKTLDGDSL